MRIGKWTVAIGLVAVLGAAVALRAGTAGAEEGKGAMPPMQKQVKHPLVDGLLGSWTSESTAAWGNGKGKLTFAMGIGGTAMLETYENRSDGAPAEAAFHGYGVFKISDDGKTLNIWWFDTHSPEPLKLTGPLTDKGYDVTGTSAMGPMHITVEKKGEGWEFKMLGADGKAQMTDTYTKAK
jgi:hypothetical protein